MALGPTDKVGSQPHDIMGRPVPTARGCLQQGLRYRALGTITIQITAGSGAATWVYKEGTTALHAAVTYAVSLANVALLIAQAINTNAAAHNWVATVSTDTITLRQRRGGASGTIALTATGDAAGAPANSGNPTGDTDTWTELPSGISFGSTTVYYELGFSGALAVGGVAPGAAAGTTTYGGGLTDAVISTLSLYVNGQAFAYWQGGLRALSDASALQAGIPIATATWTDKIAWLDCAQPLVIKLADAAATHYKAEYI